MIKKIFKFLFSIIQFVFIIFLILLFLIKIYWFICKKVNSNYYPEVNEYTYLKINNRYLFSDFKLDEYVLLKKTDSVKVGDYITVLDEKNIELYKVSSLEQTSVICIDKDNNEYTVLKDEIRGKVIYNNYEVSKILNILFKPYALLIMILYCIFIGQFTYERYA